MAKSNLVIVESPAKAKTIGKYLGPDYKVLASMGHVRDLPKSKMGVDLEHNDFEPDYQPIKGKEETIAELQEAADKSKKVYLATDPDREGEAISWHLKELLHLPEEKTSRVTFNEITKKVVTDSIAHPRDIDQNLVDAQQARRILDQHRGLPALPAAVEEDPPGPVGRPGAVCRHPARGRAGGGDPGLCPGGILDPGGHSGPRGPQSR